MAYLGNQPSNNFVSLKRQVITGNGGSTYTLDHAVASVNDVAIFVNNVRQDPATYSISGTALTLGGTISSSDSCYVIFLGQALQTVTPATGTVTNAMIVDGTIAESKLASGVNTITMAEQWRLSANVVTSTNTFLTSNLEKADGSDAGDIGTGMSESSGVFSFPSTGIYLITATGAFYQNGSVTHQFVGLEIFVTKDNSTYTRRATCFGSILGTAEEANNTSTYIMDVTDISNDKVKFHVRQQTAGNLNLAGNTERQLTGFTFVRLGDT